jgi:hypothetical protein
LVTLTWYYLITVNFSLFAAFPPCVSGGAAKLLPSQTCNASNAAPH